VRLAFAVATAKRPDILIVDEALSVGDRYFSQKSMGRIRKFLEGGTTLLFVSHDTNAVKTICNKAVLLDKGRMVDFSDPETIIEQYSSSMLVRTNNLNLIQNSENKSEKLRREWQKLRFSTQETGDFKEAYAQLDTDEIELLDYRIENSAGELLSIVYTGQVIYVKYRVKAKIPLEDLYFGFSIRDRLSVSVSNTNSFALKCSSISMQQNEVVEVCFKMRLPLQVGFYGLCMGVAQTGYESGEFEKYLLNVHNFEVIEIIRSDTRSSFGGIVNLYPEFILTQSQVDAHY
jgi:ABC-type glutathione transport system ATPase component